MSRWPSSALVALLLILATAACGNATPTTGNGLVSSASGTPGTTTVATPDVATPTPVAANTTPGSTTGPVRTADEAATRASALLVNAFWEGKDVSVTRVAWMTLGEAWARATWLPQPPPGDPSDVVWWIDFSGTFPTPSCPAPPPGTPSTGCGPSSAAVSILAASDGHVIHGFLGAADRPLATSAISLQIPSNARLQTPGDALDAGFQTVPGKNGNPPTLDSLRLMTFRQWLDEQDATRNSQVGGIDDNTPVWQVEFSNADYTPPCSMPGGCHLEHVFVALNAMDGNSLGYWGPGPPSPSYPPGTPVSATASATPAVLTLPPSAALQTAAAASQWAITAASPTDGPPARVVSIQLMTLANAMNLDAANEWRNAVPAEQDFGTPVWAVEVDGAWIDHSCPFGVPPVDCHYTHMVFVINALTGNLVGLNHPSSGPATPAP